MYIARYLEEAIIETSEHFKVLYLSGPRQVGKTTVLQQIARSRKMSYVSLDDLRLRELAKKDPVLFLDAYQPPVLIDEVQYATDLFSYIKLRVDQSGMNGQYWLTGSQHLALMEGLKESLAGRVGVMSLLGLSWAEEKSQKKNNSPFFPVCAPLKNKVETSIPSKVFERMFRGTFPALATDPKMSLDRFYGSYVQTYLDRDVRDLFGVEKMSVFQTFLGLVAARTGQILNVSTLARDAGVSVHAANSWISILEASGIIYLLRPFSTNISKRFIKAPKIYMLDTGLASYLTRWPDAQTLQYGPMAGAMFESYVVSEIIKSYLFRGFIPRLSYLRTQDGREIDLLIEHDRKIFPIEIKATANPREDDLQHIISLEKSVPQGFSQGAVVCLTDQAYPLTRTNCALPVTVIQ